MSELRNKRVLVTGATGFIGSRLSQRLAVEHNGHVTGVGRRVDAVTYLADHGANLQRAHLLDFAAMRCLLDGHDILFHVAAWLGPRHGDPENAWALNAYATEQLVRIAAQCGVSRVVLVSSIAVYGPPRHPIMHENIKIETQQHSVYGRTKAEGETRARAAAAENNIALTIARPGVVYGPGSVSLSQRVLRFLRLGVPVIFGQGEGHAHPVYIDNLIDGLVLCATHPAAPANAFNFVDRSVPWRDWFGYFAAMCGRTPRRLPLPIARVALRVAEHLPIGLSIDRDLYSYYTNRAVYPVEKARDLLGYEPRIGLPAGMARTEEWLSAEGHL